VPAAAALQAADYKAVLQAEVLRTTAEQTWNHHLQEHQMNPERVLIPVQPSRAQKEFRNLRRTWRQRHTVHRN
jgi:hypothetical protein